MEHNYYARNLGEMLNMDAMITNAQKSSSREPVRQFSRNFVLVSGIQSLYRWWPQDDLFGKIQKHLSISLLFVACLL